MAQLYLTLSINETAKALSLGRSSIYALINQGKIDTFKSGRRTLVKVESIHRYIEEQSNEH